MMFSLAAPSFSVLESETSSLQCGDSGHKARNAHICPSSDFHTSKVCCKHGSHAIVLMVSSLV